MGFLLYISMLLVAASGPAVTARKNWVLLIAGSNTYDNYRHQADVCHAYQIMHKAGIPDEQIVVMMYDDIAHNPRNPFPGNIINHPNGTNVYPGVPKDYTGADVNAKTFLAVLQGQKDEVRRLTGREGKVIDSGPDDYIFVYFADHGGPGHLCMPDPPCLQAKELNNAFASMHKDSRYAKLIFYVEACFGGSVFDNILPDDINIYVATAANPYEHSWGCYFDKAREAFLGDTFSVKWMEDTDVANLHTETFETQYERVKNRTTKSHVTQYGDKSIDKLVLEKFFGNNKQRFVNGNDAVLTAPTDQVSAEEIPFEILRRRIEAAPMHSENRIDLEKQLKVLHQTLSNTNDLMLDIARSTYSNLPVSQVYDLTMKKQEPIRNWDCYETAVDFLLDICPGLDITKNDFALKRLQVLVNLCNKAPISEIVRGIEVATVVNPICRV